MAYYKITDTELKEITKFLDKLSNPNSGTNPVNNEIKAKELSQHIKDNYTKIKP